MVANTGYIVFGMGERAHPVLAMHDRYTTPDSVTFYAYFHRYGSRETDLTTFPETWPLMLGLGSDGVLIDTDSSVLIAKPGARQPVRWAGEALMKALRKHRLPYPAVPLPLRLQDDEDFQAVTRGILPELNTSFGDIKATGLYRRELDETMEFVKNSYERFKDQPNSRPRKAALEGSIDYLTTYFTRREGIGTVLKHLSMKESRKEFSQALSNLEKELR